MIKGYSITRELYQSSAYRIHTGIRDYDRHPVIIKSTYGNPHNKDISALRHAFAVTKDLKIEGIAVPIDLVEHAHGAALIMEDTGGISLPDFITANPLTLPLILQIGADLAYTLGELHQQGIIHKNIQPSSILIEPDTAKVKITDFSIAQNTGSLGGASVHPENLEGAPAYISPEQTGRISLGIDYRSDYYSLGVVLYELLTGAPPFHGDDIVKILHSHIAKPPVRPDSVKHEIPKTVADIIMKLLSKNAEERYQSAFGITYDLKRCLAELEAKNVITDFALGGQDVCERLNLTQRIYGRKFELKELNSVLNRVARGKSEIVLIHGYAGIGKTSLIHELQRQGFKRYAYWIEGNFEPAKKDIPFHGIIQAFSEFINLILLEKPEQLDSWKTDILQALGANAQVIIDMVPKLEMVIGKQPPAPELGPVETQNRFHYLFQEVTKIFNRPERTLVLFLDDLQYIDTASLMLIETIILQEDSHHILFLGTYRDNEVDPFHPLNFTLNKIKKSSTAVSVLTPRTLFQEDIQAMLKEILGRCEADTREFAQALIRKTGGNPFFVTMFLRRIHQEGLLWFDAAQGRWFWSLEQIRLMPGTDNIIDLLITKIKRLRPETRRMLGLASCLGTSFDRDTLISLCEHPREKTLQTLQEAQQEGLLVPYSQAYKSEDSAAPGEKTLYRFLHERVHEAAQTLLSPEENLEQHRKIGYFLLHNAQTENQEENLFEIVNHLNQTCQFIKSEQERLQIARLNLAAGRKAKASTAYQQAANFLDIAIGCLPTDSWEKHSALSFAIFRHRAECEHLCGTPGAAADIFNLLLQKTHSLSQKAELYIRQLILHAGTANPWENNRLGSQALMLFGLNLPGLEDKKAIAEAFELEVRDYRLAMIDINIPELINLPEISNQDTRMVLKIIMNMLSCAYICNPGLLALLGLKSVNLCIRHGICPDVTFAFCAWGLLLGAHFKDYAAGHAFGKLAMQFNRLFNNTTSKAKTISVFSSYINLWRNPLEDSIALLQQAHQAANETGDFVYAGISRMVLIRYQYIQGHKNLESLLTEIDELMPFYRKVNDSISMERLMLIRHVIINLMGENEPASLSSDAFNENSHIANMQQLHHGTGIALYYFYKLQCLYLYEQYTQARHMADLCIAHLNYLPNAMEEAETIFFASLTLCALFKEAGPEDQEHMFDQLQIHLERMKTWQTNSPDNFDCRVLLLQAELARINGLAKEAETFYDAAANAARQNGFLNVHALVCELAAKFHQAEQREHIAAFYLQNALSSYQNWGAHGKARLLKNRLTSLLTLSCKDPEPAHTPLPEEIPAFNKTRQDPDIDLLSVIKASQALSNEIILERLVENLMHIVMENAGATNGALFIMKDEQPYLSAYCRPEDGIVLCRPEEILETVIKVPETIIQYVLRTKEPVVLGDTAHKGRYTADPHMNGQDILSVLCLPVIEQTRITGILYLENNLTKNAFTHKRITTLQLLSTQIAISLKNALTYEELMQTKESLRESEADYRNLFNNLQDVYYQADQSGKMTLLSPSVEQMFGYKPSELAGRDLAQTLYVQPSLRALFLKALEKTGYVENYETQIKHKDGTIIWVAANSHYFYDKDGCIQGVEGMLRNITEHKKTETELLKTQKLESLGVVAGGIAHDFNNMLTAILGNASLVMELIEPGSHVHERMVLLEKAAMQAKELTQQLMTFAKGGVPVKKTVSTGELLRSSTRFALSGTNAKDELRLAEELWPVFADEGQINQAIHNLLINAVQAMPEGGLIHINAENINMSHPGPLPLVAGDYVKIGIRDHGQGIHPAIINKIFDPFFTTKPKGNGLGLSSTFSIIQMHAGHITVDSQTGEGTTFEVYLPASHDKIDEKKHISRTVTATGTGRVLLMDDNELIRKTCGSMLGSLGYEVAFAADGLDAIEKCRLAKEENRPFSVVIMDLTIPGGMGGMEAVAAIRSIDTNVKIVASSGHANTPVLTNFNHYGFDGIIAKPYGMTDLKAALAMH